MAEKVRTMRLSKLMYAIFVFGVCVLFCCRYQSYAADISVSWNTLSISTDGDCNYDMNYSGSLVVDKYELKLARKNNGTWTTSYKTAKTSDTSYSFSISATGQYYFTVRAIFVGGDKSTWSGQSNTVSVKSEDIDHGDTPSGSPAYYIVPTSGGQYVVPAGPGVSGYQYTSATIGPDGSTTYTGTTTATTAAGPGTGYTVNSGTTITGNTGSSGWVRDGNNWRYRYANNTYAAGTWDRINDHWYYFNDNGIMATGWVYYNKNWYLCDLNGQMQTGWHMVNNKWYYMDKSGIMQTGYIEVDGIHYYCDQTGARLQGAYNPDGHYYDESGVQIK